ncbi:unnamed protein product, partial [Timema podura]|nr:unnamed protein product [Timema podura]
QSPPIISTPNSTSITATITTAVPTVPSGNVSSKDEGASVQERRPSWRLRVDNVDRSKFLLEDARNRSSVGDTPNYIRRTSGGGSSATTRPSSAPVEGVTADATVTIALRRQGKPPEDKEQDKENDIRNAQATQGVIQRRRRPKRRSTGVVHVDMDEIDPDRQEKLDGDIVSKLNNNERPAMEKRSALEVLYSAYFVPILTHSAETWDNECKRDQESGGHDMDIE